MNKRDLVDEVSAARKASPGQTATIVDALLGAITRALADGRTVSLRRFGTFAVRPRRSRMARHPRSGEAIRVPAKLVPVFRAGALLRERVRAGGER